MKSKRFNKLFNYIFGHPTELLCIICFICVYIMLVIPLFPLDCPLRGHDRLYHYLRVDALKYNIENNSLFSGIDYLFFDGGGYAGSAYPNLFVYIPALLRVAGLGIGESMSFFLLLCNAFSYLTMFLFMKKLSGSQICGTIAAVMYTLSGYRLDNIFVRFALGEIQAYVFWPLILYGLYDLIFDEFKKPYIIGIGIGGMLLCHSISTALALGLCVVVFIIFIGRILKTPKKLLTLSITAGCVVLSTAYYWLPLLELLGSCEMSVKIPAYHTSTHAIEFTSLFSDNAHNGIAGMGFTIFLICFLRLFLTQKSPLAKRLFDKDGKRTNTLVIADTCMILGFILALLSTSVAPWKFLSMFMDSIQFPWRFFAPASLLLIVAGAVYIFHIAHKTKVPKLAMIMVTAVSISIAGIHLGISGVSHADHFDSNYYAVTEGATYYIGAGEWLPRATQGDGIDTLRKLQDNVLLNNNVKIPCERVNGTLSFDLESQNAEYVIAPYVWYKGYTAADENGRELVVSMSENGLVRVDLHGANGQITIQHKPTTVKIISYFISLAGILFILAITIIPRVRRTKQTQ